MSEVDQMRAEESTEGTPPKKTSIFFEKYIIWIIVVFLVTATVLQIFPFILLAIFLLILSLTISFWKKRALNNVIPSISLEKSRIFAGETTSLCASIRNNKWLPLVWLEWEMEQQKGIMFDNNEKGKYMIRILWLLSFKETMWSISVDAKQRGVYNFGNMVKLRSGDGFQFSEVEKNYELLTKLYVYPKLVPVRLPKLPLSAQTGNNGKKGGFIEDPLLIRGVREYVAGDEWRRINWKATARKGQLHTSTFELITPNQVQFIVYVDGFQTDESSDELELFLSIIASVAVGYHRQGVKILFDNNDLSLTTSRNITPFLDYLAEIKPAQMIQPLSRISSSVPAFIFCWEINNTILKTMEASKNNNVFIYYMKTKKDHVVKKGKTVQIRSLLTS